jgi:phosphoglycerol transferase
MMILAVLIRFVREKDINVIYKSSFPIALTFLSIAVSFSESILRVFSGTQSSPIRIPIESVLYSGQLIDSIVPSVVSQLPLVGVFSESLKPINDWANASGQAGVRWVSDQGSFFTLIGFVAITFMILGLNSNRQGGEEVIVVQHSIQVFVVAGAVLSSWVMVPFGIQTLFAALVSPQLRAWDRIIPYWQLFLIIAFCFFLDYFLRSTKSLRRPAALLSLISCSVVVIAFDTALPARPFFESQTGLASQKFFEARTVAEESKAVFGKECGIFQLPFIPFPEHGPMYGLGVHDPLWLPLAGAENRWSYGGLGGSPQAAWLEKVSNSLPSSSGELRKHGFCGILLDKRGYDIAELNRIRELLDSNIGASIEISEHFVGYRLNN